jgi:CheY-like chemotaxis protein
MPWTAAAPFIRWLNQARLTASASRNRASLSAVTASSSGLLLPYDRALILILSDINMPGMTGLELLPKAKAARPDVPVIMITAYGDDSTRRIDISPYAPSRSRIGYRGICSEPLASVI